MKTQLQTKLDMLCSFSRLDTDLVNRFGTILQELDDYHLYRINPLIFAEEHELPEDQTVELFLYGTKIGLFDFSYNMICPACGGVLNSHLRLDEIDPASYFCSTCEVKIPTMLDDQLEVAFTIAQGVKPLNLPYLDNLESYFRYAYSANVVKSEKLLNLIKSLIKGFYTIPAQGSLELELDTFHANQYKLVSVETNSSVLINSSYYSSREGNQLEVKFLDTGFSPSSIEVLPGKHVLNIQNLTRAGVGFLLLTPKLDKIFELVGQEPDSIQIRPFFSAKMLLNHQTFRELFRVQELSSSLNLNVRNLTLLFTDLRGSTDVFDRAGDLYAHGLIQEHFRLLTDSVRQHHGAVIKTMGDAIMAAFSAPIDGFRAALDMFNKMQQLNEGIEESYRMGLKIGLNAGPALAVMSDERLDYFGTSVNIAARVQGLADSEELWMTESVFETPEVQQQLKETGVDVVERTTKLKGIGQDARVFGLRAPA